MSRYASLDDLNRDLDHDSLLDDDGEFGSLDSEDIELLTPARRRPAPAPAKPKKKAAKKTNPKK